MNTARRLILILAIAAAGASGQAAREASAQPAGDLCRMEIGGEEEEQNSGFVDLAIVYGISVTLIFRQPSV